MAGSGSNADWPGMRESDNEAHLQYGSICRSGSYLSGFKQVLDQIRRESKTEVELGGRFERIMLQFFKNDGEYATQFKDVVLWKDYSSEIDKGIDLVATDYHGEKWAIQCKCWKDDAYIGLKEVGTTFASAKEHKIDSVIIIFTGRTISRELEKTCKGTDTHIIRRSRLEGSMIKWDTNPKKIKTHEPYKLKDHQKDALKACMKGFKKYDRGKCIMACGTGKTLTSLRIAETQAGKGCSVLYLVPSISLVRQTMHEWATNRMIPHNYLIVCSDKTVGKEDVSITNLSGRVTTKVATIKKYFKEMLERADTLHVVFSTYQSSDKVRDAFTKHEFDLIIFDEAHRTAAAVKDADTNFTLAHHNENIRGKKRLYMTATPRIHKESVKIRARESDRTLYSMEDKGTFGEIFYKLKFSDAIRLGILSDYRVVAFEVSKEEMADLEATHGDEAHITLEESTKLSSVYHAIMSQDNGKTHNLLQRIIVFCNSIRASKDFSIGRFAPKPSKKSRFDGTLSQGRFKQMIEKENRKLHTNVRVYTDHVDGTYNSRDRDDQLDWIKDDLGEDECRILSNAQCLSEGVDVPALDGVVFYEPRSSVIDVVQAVGRVMRYKAGKEFGYVIVPVVTTAEGDMETASQTNKTYKTQMQVIDALRDHDDRIERFYNQMQLTRGQQRYPDIEESVAIPPPLAEVSRPLKALIMKKVGGFYFEDYGKRLGEVAADIKIKIRSRVEKPDQRDAKYVGIIDNLHANLVGTIGETVTREDTIRALAQHVTIKPVFDQLFKMNFSNPVSKAFDAAVADLIFREETEPLQEYYEDMAYQIENITNESMRQVVIKKIYDNFFKGFDENTSAEHGIVYTPVEVVDYIIHSIQYVLKTEFGVGFDDDAVKVLDPFAGTGVFIVRLMQSGLLGSNIHNKYKKDLHMNELLLLAYYVATVNIETTYYKMKKRHVPYDNGCYVDTFTLDPEYLKQKREGQDVGEQTKLDKMFRPVQDRVRRQQKSNITVIMGNPPWNVDKSTTHEKVEKRIDDTYKKHTKVTLDRSLKNSYIKAIRYASDRTVDSGVIGFILPASWLSGNAQAGLRAALYEEFTDIWCFDLLGEKNKEGHGRNIFEYSGIHTGGTTQQSTIVLLVKNAHKTECTIHYTKLGVEDYNGEDKRNKVREYKAINQTPNWDDGIQPNDDHDWLNQRDPHIKQDYYKKCMPMGIRKGAEQEPSIFGKFSNGIKSNRDSWVYNTSYDDLVDNMKRTITHCTKIDPNNPDTNPQFVHWGKTKSPLKVALKRMHPVKPKFEEVNIRLALLRPFIKQYLYLDDGVFVSFPYHIPAFFPVRNITKANYAITVGPVGPDPTRPDPTRPDPTRPDPTRPDPTRPDPTRPDPTRPDPTRPDPTRPDPTRPDPTPTRPDRPDPTRPDPTRPDPTRPDPTRPDPTRPDPTRPDPTRPDPTRPDPTRPDPTRPDPTRPDPTRPDPTRPDPTRPDHTCSDQAVQGSSSPHTRRINKQSPTDKNSHTGGHERGNSGARQDIGVHSVHIEPSARLGDGTPQPNVPIQEGMNVAIIVPDKIKDKFSTFISNLPSDLHVLATSQAFPMEVME